MATQKLSIGTTVKFLMGMDMTGVIIAYNKNTGGFYPGSRYPYIIRRSDGEVFEYDENSFEVLQLGLASNRPEQVEVSMPTNGLDSILNYVESNPKGALYMMAVIASVCSREVTRV